MATSNAIGTGRNVAVEEYWRVTCESWRVRGARTFDQRPNSVCLHVFETLKQSAGPPNVHVVDARCDSQAKVDTQIALRDIALNRCEFRPRGRVHQRGP